VFGARQNDIGLASDVRQKVTNCRSMLSDPVASVRVATGIGLADGVLRFLGWGLVLQGDHAAGPLILAEYRVSGGTNMPEKWRTLTAVRIARADHPLAAWKRRGAPSAGERLAADVVNAAVSPARDIVGALGGSPAAAAPLPAADGWTVWEGSGPGQAPEMDERRMRALGAWDRPDLIGAFGPYVLVVRESTLNEEELQSLLDAVSRAPSIIETLPDRHAS
jgi:hypothetical protein